MTNWGGREAWSVKKYATFARLLAAGIGAAVFAASSASALAWGGKGHHIVNHVAALSLPSSVPAFMRTAAAIDEIGNLGIELDLLKGAGTAWDASNDPGHYVDVGDDNTIFGLPLTHLPATQEAYNAALQARGTDQYKAGYLPYSILEGWQQLRMDFAYWRVNAYESTHAATAGIRAKATITAALTRRWSFATPAYGGISSLMHRSRCISACISTAGASTPIRTAIRIQRTCRICSKA